MENNFEKNNVEVQEETGSEAPEATTDSAVEVQAKKKLPIWIIPVAIAIVIGIAMAIIIPTLFGEKEPVYQDYTITVVDGVGNPMSNIIVKITTPDGETKTRVTEKDGVASLKNVIAGEYKIVIEAGFSDAIILTSEYTLTEDVNTLYVAVRDGKKSIDIYGNVAEGAYASSIDTGSYDITCAAGQSSYYLFYARTPGVYSVSLASNDTDMTVGYYGMPMFVTNTHCADGDYDGRSFEIIVQDITTPYVFGINATKNATAHLTIERTGDAPFNPTMAEWTEVKAPEDIPKCDTTGKTLVDLDIADSTLTVSLGDDGYYYTGDGKLVYIRITSVTGHSYVNEDQQLQPVLGGSLALLAGHVDQNVGINIGGYVYDENGNFVNKYRYNEMIKAYMEKVDAKYGVVPLSEDLARCIKQHGGSNDWFNPNNPGAYLFSEIDVYTENAWLFLCMVEQ